MTQVLTGPLSEVIKQAIDAQIPPAAQVQLSWEEREAPGHLADKRSAIADAPTYSLEEFEAAMDEIGEGTESIPFDPTVRYDRADFYLDHD